MSTRTLTLLLVSLALLASFVFVGVPRAIAVPGTDDYQAVCRAKLAVIAKNTEAFAAAWNRHDAKSLAALWASDGDLIDPWGVTSVGRANVEKFFTKEHARSGPLGNCTYELKSNNARLITGAVAVSDWQVVLTGLIGPDGKGMGPMIHHVVIVWVMEDGKWEIAAARPGVPGPVAGDAVAVPRVPGK